MAKEKKSQEKMGQKKKGQEPEAKVDEAAVEVTAHPDGGKEETHVRGLSSDSSTLAAPSSQPQIPSVAGTTAQSPFPKMWISQNRLCRVSISCV